MTDLRITLFEDGPDITLENGDVAFGPGLAEAVLNALFSDARASDDELAAAGFTDPRGWPLEDPNDRWGSRLWLVARAKLAAGIGAQVRTFGNDALAWAVREGVAERVEVRTVERPEAERLELEVLIERGSARQWSSLWEGLESGATAPSTVGAVGFRLLYR